MGSSTHIGWLLLLVHTGTGFKPIGSFLPLPFFLCALVYNNSESAKPQPFRVKSLWFRPEVRVSVQQDDGNLHNCVYWDGDVTNICVLHTET